MLVLDVEIFRDYFLIAFKDSETDNVRHFEAYEGHPLDRSAVRGIMRTHQTISFNGIGFDLPLIALALQGFTVAALKRVADRIIRDRVPHWTILRGAETAIPADWDHIDVMNVAPGMASLKIYGGRLHAPRLQDLPIAPDASITPEQRAPMREYCVNDLDTTLLLYRELENPIALRVQMSEQYGMNLRSKSDAQIAETVIKSELSKISGKTYRAPTMPSGYGFHYKDPGIVRFESEQLQDLFASLLKHRFELQPNGSVKMPDWLKATKLNIGGAQYQMGIGGLHSCEKRQAVSCGDDERLYELDVASYYPSIILQQRIAPDTLGHDFLRVYQSIFDRRIAAKRSGDKTESDIYKLQLNSSFGKMGSKYSALYAPNLLIQTTVTGQLCLLMLIERMAAIGVRVVSANTDGVVLHHHKDLERQAEQVAWEWMLDTSYTLERTNYRAIASRDINSYAAIKPDGSTKGKGCFAVGGMMKNPDQTIVYRAVTERIANGTPIEDTINASQDVREFVTVRQVKGGAVWRDELLGKAVRFYLSLDVPQDQGIHYASNNNRVPKSAGAKPLMSLPDEMPEDVDRQAYIVAAEKLLCEVGF